MYVHKPFHSFMLSDLNTQKNRKNDKIVSIKVAAQV